jgi:hypothetical protein
VAEHDVDGWRNSVRWCELSLGFFQNREIARGGNGVEERGRNSGERPVRRGRGCGACQVVS